MIRALSLAMLGMAFSATSAEVCFQEARPVWPEGRESEKNLFVSFRAVADKPSTLRITASSLYRVLVNGVFVAHGPARAGHGFYRVDEWSLPPGTVEIEVAGYNVNSFYLLDQPSFLQAEMVANGNVIAATGGSGFEAFIQRARVQKVARYSFQRPFSEVWRLPARRDPVKCVLVAAKPLLPRRVPYPTFALVKPVAHIAAGTLAKGELPKKVWKDRSLVNIGSKLKGFPETELETIPSIELQAVRTISSGAASSDIVLTENSFHIVDFGVNLTGFIGATITARAKTRLFFAFDEILSNGDVDWKRLGCVNIVLYELEPGTYKVESFEPYTLRYLKLMVLEGDCEVTDVYLRQYVNPDAGRATFATSDERLNRIFAAARRTFEQNATDVFMDCPSRERAGWLCDSFFTARVARDLCGDTVVERNFFENFLLPERFQCLPDGMLPMCYPSDHYDGVFIPNWAMWFVVQLEEYLERSGDRDLVEALRPRVMRLLEYFQPFENEDGLLEKLPGWVFVEWSKANSFVQDINYPSNMLYARTLDVVGRLYQRPDLTQKAARLRETIRAQSFDGEFFVDNAVRKNGRREVTRNRSEVCQYFAFFFGIATTESHPALWKTLVTDFGPHRKQTKAHPDIHPANAFIGNMLRFELLSRAGRTKQILDEAIGYWLYMADRTGTLWEHDAPQASCNHGFASHAAHVFYRDVLGLYQVDPRARSIQLRLTDLPLDWCEGTMPVPDGVIQMRWWKEDNKLACRFRVPDGYRVNIQNLSGKELVNR